MGVSSHLPPVLDSLTNWLTTPSELLHSWKLMLTVLLPHLTAQATVIRELSQHRGDLIDQRLALNIPLNAVKTDMIKWFRMVSFFKSQKPAIEYGCDELFDSLCRCCKRLRTLKKDHIHSAGRDAQFWIAYFFCYARSFYVLVHITKTNSTSNVNGTRRVIWHAGA